MPRTPPFRLYLVTDRKRTCGRPLIDVVEAALAGGVDAVQLREKDLSTQDLHDLALRLKALCLRHGARLLINDRVDVALAADADGVQLPVNSFAPADARRLLGPRKLISASTHSIAEARAACGAGADVIVFGPLFDTPSKRSYGPPVGLAQLDAVSRAVRVPVIGIGGVSTTRVSASVKHGAAGIAVISTVLEADDPESAARTLKQAVLQAATAQSTS